MWDCWLDVDRVPTDGVIWGLYGVGSRCVLQMIMPHIQG